MVARLRAFELIAANEEPIIPVSRSTYRVHSQSRDSYYTISRKQGHWWCTCDGFDAARGRCKHIWAVEIWREPAKHYVQNSSESSSHKSYGQDWPAYDAGQQDEHRLFDRLLWGLLEDVVEPVRPVGKRGRPPIPLRVQLLHSIRKVHLNKAAREVKGLLDTIYAGGLGIVEGIPNYATPSRLFNQPFVSEILVGLIERSSLPLKDIEETRTVAIDSSGFCLTCMSAYCTEKHDPTRKHKWIKAHVIIGVKTHIILDVRITDEHGADCPQLIPMLEDLVRRGFRPRKVLGDKAYLSRENYRVARTIGADAYFPFKPNSVGTSKGSCEWARKYHQFQLKREEFDHEYRQRSNVEAVFSAIKRKLGEPLFSKNVLSQFNELLAKLLAYNIGIVIHEMHEHGIDPEVNCPPDPPYVPPVPVFEPAPCDSNGEVVIEFEVVS